MDPETGTHNTPAPGAGSIAAELDAYISVDVEASGPNPGRYSLLTIGACTVAPPRQTFYIELQPVTPDFTAEAMAINQLTLAELVENGLPAAEAMARFESWLSQVVPPGKPPIFVAFNAPFDWMFVSDYFHRFLGRNPFGHKALDIKAVHMGLCLVPWGHTSHREISQHYLKTGSLTHHALQDAVDEAEIFWEMLKAFNPG